MNDFKKFEYDTMSEADFAPVLELLQGGDPQAIAKKAGISVELLLKMRDDLLAQAELKRTELSKLPSAKIGRNDPCPCGSGKKYKNCCMKKHEAAKKAEAPEHVKAAKAKEKEQQQLIGRINKASDLMIAGRYEESIQLASKLLVKYPNEDRLHDILATCHLYSGNCEKAVEICRCRMEVAESEKAYFIQHGRYRDAEIDQPALSYYYPPMTWLQKYWTAKKASEYRSLYPKTVKKEIGALIKKLLTADDPNRFPKKQAEGLEMRRQALSQTLEKLKTIGPEVIPYLLPLACKYSWAGIFVPEILAAYKTDLSARVLIDISMFGFAYASGASLHYLETLKEAAIPYIEEAFSRDKEFDPIKTGIVSVLGNIQTPASYALLMRLLEHDSAHIVNWAGSALGRFNNPEALPAMIAANQRIGGQAMIDAAIQKLKNGSETM